LTSGILEKPPERKHGSAARFPRLVFLPRSAAISPSCLFISPLISLARSSALALTSVARIANGVCLIHATRYAREPRSSLFFHRLVLVLISRRDEATAVYFPRALRNVRFQEQINPISANKAFI